VFKDGILKSQRILVTGGGTGLGKEMAAKFLELGAEVGSGRSFPSSDQNKNGASTWAALAHIGGDIGASYAWRAGVSYLRTGATDRPYDDVDSLGNPVFNTFSGNTRMWIADAVLKWAPQGNATATNGAARERLPAKG